MTTEPLLFTTRDDGVAIVSTADDPLNRMTLEYVDRMNDVVDEIAGDDSIRAFVVTAEGTTNFSVGMNLEQLPEGIERAGGVDPFFDRRLDLIARIETMGKPSVATLFGSCLGGGLELPLGCTFRLAAELLAADRAAVHTTMGTPDAREGMTALIEKRPPVFNQEPPGAGPT